eukprot:6479140-Amphidinium_carterae.2
MEALLRRYAKVSLALDKAEQRDLEHVTECAKMYLALACQDALSTHASSPVLLQYSCDCTRSKVRKHVSAQSTKVMKRSSVSSAAEFFVQQVFVTIHTGSELVQKLVFAEPRELQFGKTMRALAAVSGSFIDSIHLQGSRLSVTILHQVHDRGLSGRFKSCVSSLMERHVLADPEKVIAGAVAEDLVISVEIGCSLHDLHNALKWCYQCLFADAEEGLQNMYIGFNTMKSGMSVVLQALGRWLLTNLLPLADEELPKGEVLHEYFTALGVDADDVQLLAHDCKLLWCTRREKLLVSATFLEKSDSINIVSALLLGLYKFNRFCGSRWLTIGVACRNYMISSSLGFGSLFQHLKANHYISEYDSAGASKLGVREGQMAAVLGLTAYAPESMMADLMRDGRLMQQLDVLEATLNEKCHYLEHLTANFWETMGTFVALTPTVLRDMVLRGMQTIRGYIELKIFSTARDFPWCLSVGNLSDNVAALAKRDDPPSDMVSYKLWKLLSLGMDRSEIERVLYLLSSCSCTSHFTEKQHASTTLVRRHHDFGPGSLMSRAFMHTLRF